LGLYPLINDNMRGKSEFNYRVIVAPIFVIMSLSGLAFSLYILYIANTLYLQFLGLGFTILSFVSMIFGIASALWYYKSYDYEKYFENMNKNLKKLDMKKLPTVAVVVPVYNEDSNMVEKSLQRLLEIDYDKSKLKFYLLDDSTNLKIRNEMKELCKKYKINLILRGDRRGLKAGALNNFLKYSKEEFVAIFDSDEKLVNKGFLLDLLPFFKDKQVAYVQTEKTYARGNLFSDSVKVFDAVFYRFIQAARALNNTAIFAGSCGIIRRAALDAVGNFPEYVVEDTFFSFECKRHGYKSVYVPKVYALGKPLKTFTEFAKQQWRYNYGGTQFFGYFLKKGEFTKRSALSNLDYLTHGFGLNYISIVLVIYTLLSVGVILSALPIVHISVFSTRINSTIFGLEMLGLLSFSASLLTPLLLSRIYFRSWSKGLMVFFLNYSLAIVRTRAALATLLGGNDPGSGWDRLKIKTSKRELLRSIANTKAEITFSGVLVIFAIIAYMRYNISAATWIGFYAVMFSLATVFIYKYG